MYKYLIATLIRGRDPLQVPAMFPDLCWSEGWGQNRWVVDLLNVWYFLSNMEGRWVMEGE